MIWAMAELSCVSSAMSPATLVSAGSTSLMGSSSLSTGPFSSAVRLRSGNPARVEMAALSLSFRRDVRSGCAIFQLRSRLKKGSEVAFVKFGQLDRRRRCGAVVTVRALAAAAVAESEEAEKSKEKEMIGKLLSLVEGSDRGARFGNAEHGKVGDLVGQLEQYGIPEPLKSPLIFGDWDVAYSSNPTSPGGGYRTWIGRLIFKTREMLQAVNVPDIIVNAVRFSLFGIFPGEVQLRGKLEPLDEKLIRIDFEAPYFQLGPFKFQYGKVSSVKIAIIYLDERVRLGRGSRGTVFVFTRR